MKRIFRDLLFTLFATILIGAIGIPSAYATTGSIKARASSSSVTLGNSVTVTVNVSSSAPLGSWQYVLKYDTSKLKLTSTNNDTYIVDYGNGSKTSASYTYTFKTTAEGSASVSVSAASIVDWSSETEIATTTAGCTISINKAVVVTKSSNNNLSNLTVSEGDLTPSFSANVTEYTVSVDKLIDNITLTATKADNTASITGDGALNVSEGLNNFNIVVTAENGTAKTYHVAVTIVDSNPIQVKIDGDTYTVIKKSGSITVPNNYTNTTVPISGIDVAAYQNEVTNLVLVGLKDKDGNAKLYVYNANKDTYEPYNEILGGSTTLYIYSPDNDIKIPVNYKHVTIKINDISVDAWQLASAKDESMYIVYGMNVSTGKTGFYSYDKKENTFQRFDNSQVISLQKNLNLYRLIITIISPLLIASIVLLILQFIKIKKIK